VNIPRAAPRSGKFKTRATYSGAVSLEHLRRSFDLMLEREPDLGTRFYERLLERDPDVADLFDPRRLLHQEGMLVQALRFVLEYIDSPRALAQAFGARGEQHVDHGVTDAMYELFGVCLWATFAEIADDAWTPTVAQAWADLYTVIVQMMRAGELPEESAA
jgi:hemoglobin-like flavoprotein